MTIRHVGSGKNSFAALVAVLILMFAMVPEASAENCPAVAGSSNTGPKPVFMQELLMWIGQHTDYDVTPAIARLPEIVFSDCGDNIIYENEEITVEDHTKGLYDAHNYTIILIRPWHEENLNDVSTLLHELVHVEQHEKRHWLCPQKTEWEAYKLQETWLKENGIDPDFNWVMIYLMSSCAPRDFHPFIDRRN